MDVFSSYQFVVSRVDLGKPGKVGQSIDGHRLHLCGIRKVLMTEVVRLSFVVLQVAHREGFCMSCEAISTVAHRMINDAQRTSRRGFLTQVGAASLGIGVPMSTTIAQETQRSSIGDGKEVSLGEKLARYATSLRYEDLPEEVVRIAKRTILDTLGCAFGGYSAGPSKIAMKLASDVNS